jgi:chromate transport protein ChrA
MLEILVIVLSFVPIVFISYLCQISRKRENRTHLFGSITLAVIYFFLLIIANQPQKQLFIIFFAAIISYKLLKKYVEIIKKERNEAILDSFEASYQKFAMKPRRRKD